MLTDTKSGQPVAATIKKTRKPRTKNVPAQTAPEQPQQEAQEEKELAATDSNQPLKPKGLFSRSATMQLAAQLRSIDTGDLPSANELEKLIIQAANSDFCIAYAGDSAVLIHKFASKGGDIRLSKIATDGMLDYMKAFEYQSYNGKFIERKRANGFNLWLQHPECDRKGRIIFDPSVEIGEEGDDYNLWSGFRAEGLTDQPDSEYASIFEEYVRECLCPDEPEACEYVLNWLAHMVQRPASKPGVAIAVNSTRKGTGKSILGSMMRVMIGSAFIRLDKANQITGQFTGHLASSIFVNAEESCFVGDSKANDAIKNAITSEVQFVEKKGKDGFLVDSFHRYYITSNHHHFVNASDDERRYLILNNNNSKYYTRPDRPIQSHRDFFARVSLTDFDTGKEIPERTVALFQYLGSRNITQFNPKNVPNTKEMISQKELSYTPMESFIHNIMSGEVFRSTQPSAVFEGDLHYDREAGQFWIKKTAFLRLFGEYQNRYFHPSKREHIAPNTVKRRLESTGIMPTHISEKMAGTSQGLTRGSRYWVFDEGSKY